jgi:hypothetical protein
MNKEKQFPDLIKAGLKVGDTVHSYIFGEGTVANSGGYVIGYIVVDFKDRTLHFDSNGFHDKKDCIPCIHLQPWNPLAGEPFPFPKWKPIVGEVYAFWQNGSNKKIFAVGEFEGMQDDEFYRVEGVGFCYDNCAPISEALRIFGFDKVGEGNQ